MAGVTGPAPAPVSIAAEPGRAGRQVVGLVGAVALMAGVAALGAWTIGASIAQHPGRPEAWLGSGFGVLFLGLGLVAGGTGIAAVRRVRRLGRAVAVLRLDDAGVTGPSGAAVP